MCIPEIETMWYRPESRMASLAPATGPSGRPSSRRRRGRPDRPGCGRGASPRTRRAGGGPRGRPRAGRGSGPGCGCSRWHPSRSNQACRRKSKAPGSVGPEGGDRCPVSITTRPGSATSHRWSPWSERRTRAGVRSGRHVVEDHTIEREPQGVRGGAVDLDDPPLDGAVVAEAQDRRRDRGGPPPGQARAPRDQRHAEEQRTPGRARRSTRPRAPGGQWPRRRPRPPRRARPAGRGRARCRSPAPPAPRAPATRAARGAPPPRGRAGAAARPTAPRGAAPGSVISGPSDTCPSPDPPLGRAEPAGPW